METLLKAFAAFGIGVTGLIIFGFICAFAEWLGEWKRRLANHRAASDLESEIAALKAKLAIAESGGPYRTGTTELPSDSPVKS